jgi:Protein of unknown function (DUF3396)
VEPAQTFYNQLATHFRLPLYLRGTTEVDGRLIIELAESFFAQLLFPGTRVTALNTKRAGMGANLNMGDFTSARWKGAQKKLLNGEYAVVQIEAETPDFPHQKIWFSSHVNPPGGAEHLGAGTITLQCSVSYLRHVAASPEKIEALLQIAKRAWNGVAGRPAYGYGHLAITLARPPFDPRASNLAAMRLFGEYVKPPDERVHAVPIAYVGTDIDGNLESLYTGGRGIKGAFWANFLSEAHVTLAGGEAALKEKLTGLRIDRLNHGGLLVVAADSPLPEDTAATRDRFWRLDAALQPAFLSRDETPEMKRGLLGYFYRERPPVR